MGQAGAALRHVKSGRCTIYAMDHLAWGSAAMQLEGGSLRKNTSPKCNGLVVISLTVERR